MLSLPGVPSDLATQRWSLSLRPVDPGRQGPRLHLPSTAPCGGARGARSLLVERTIVNTMVREGGEEKQAGAKTLLLNDVTRPSGLIPTRGDEPFTHPHAEKLPGSSR